MKWIDKIIKKYKYIYINFIDIYFLKKKKKKNNLGDNYTNFHENKVYKYTMQFLNQILLQRVSRNTNNWNKKNTTTVH